jgi:hypothetical protein
MTKRKNLSKDKPVLSSRQGAVRGLIFQVSEQIEESDSEPQEGLDTQTDRLRVGRSVTCTSTRCRPADWTSNSFLREWKDP